MFWRFFQRSNLNDYDVAEERVNDLSVSKTILPTNVFTELFKLILVFADSVFKNSKTIAMIDPITSMFVYKHIIRRSSALCHAIEGFHVMSFLNQVWKSSYSRAPCWFPCAQCVIGKQKSFPVSFYLFYNSIQDM